MVLIGESFLETIPSVLDYLNSNLKKRNPAVFISTDSERLKLILLYLELLHRVASSSNSFCKRALKMQKPYIDELVITTLFSIVHFLNR